MKEIKVLGPGCAKCKKLADNTEEAAKASGIEFDFEYVTDIEKILNYGIMMTPGLVIDNKVVSTGKVLSVKDIGNMLKS